jgi:hypothetical protein
VACPRCELFKHFFFEDLRSKHNTFSRDKFTIHSKAVVCQDVELKGDITIGSGIAVEIFQLARRSCLIFDRNYRTSKGNYFCHCGSHRDWGQLHHRGSCHHREQVSFTRMTLWAQHCLSSTVHSCTQTQGGHANRR